MGRFVCIGAVLLALIQSAGCSRSPDVIVENPREVIHQEVMADERNCFLNTLAYCVEDRANLDAIIDELVETRFHGEMPTTRRHITRLVRSVGMRYHSASLETEAGRAQVLARMMERYENPPITFENGIARADLGFVPTGFSQRRRSWVLADSSPLMERNQPKTTHVARQLLRLRDAHPDAVMYSVEARAPQGMSRIRFEARWRPGVDMISVTQHLNELRTTAPIGANLEALLDGTVSLSDGLHSCARESALTDPLCSGIGR
ncbi:MAG: hypothetical protein ACI9KE_001404 [Polyangiales bacterium]|jgi:hypothetical protein